MPLTVNVVTLVAFFLLFSTVYIMQCDYISYIGKDKKKRGKNITNVSLCMYVYCVSRKWEKNVSLV